MCDRCDTINKTIARYRWLKGQITDLQANKATDTLVTKLEAEKLALHPVK